MRKKPLTKLIVNLLSKVEGPLKASDIAHRLDVPSNKVHQTLYNLCTKNRISRPRTGYYSLKAVETEKLPTQPTHDHMNKLHRENLVLENRLRASKSEIDKYHQWCLDWKAMVEKAENDKKEWEKKYGHSLAVITYLEDRLMNIMKHVHDTQ